MIPASAAPRVVTWLRAAPDGPAPVVHQGRDATYVDVAGRCVGLLGRHAVRVPCGLRTDLDRVDVTRAETRHGVLHVDDEPVLVGRMVDVRVPRLDLDLPGATAPDVAGTLGSGDGLTPYADDVLCGWLAVHRAAGVATPEVDAEVRANAHRTTLLSATLLEHALHGEVLPEFAAWLRALGGPDEGAAASVLEAVGHSSGRGLLEGARTALDPGLTPACPTPRGAA